MVSILQPFVKKSYAQLSCSFVSKFGARFICPCLRRYIKSILSVENIGIFFIQDNFLTPFPISEKNLFYT